ncbi:LysR family transcriptional regulator [Variovorax sp. dw_954]|uniref:LysR family transcriptional regulator n=1 Tax=Variovorax sp. dw_954 TaxID=2720078 RepID=UPI001BD662BD|nr:LysR family transcriptional regulator [Variovorax sp. dw_954]
MDIRRLEHFVAAADAGSLSLASRYQYISQSALTRQIQLLEREFDVALFERNTRGVVLTEAGELLRERARSLLTQIGHLKREVNELDREPSGTLRMGMPPSVREAMGVSLITRYRNAYARVHLEVMEGLSYNLAKMLSDGTLDCAIFIGDDASGLPIVMHNLRTEPVVAVSHVDAGLRMNRPVDLEWVVRQPLVVARSNRKSLGLDRECALRGLVLNVVMDIQALHLGLDLVQSGMISLVVPYSAAAAALLAGKVSAAPVEALSTTWVAGWPAENAPNLATRKLIEWIKLEAEHWPELASASS